MKNYFVLLIVLLGLPITTYSQDESFEATVPSYWSTTNGTLSTSTDHYKDGTQSLQWNWNSGAVLTISNVQSHGLSTSQVLDYYYHFFRMWVYNNAAIPGGELQIEFYDNNNNKQFFYSFGVNYSGWRAATADYKDEMSGNKASTNITTIKIKAPTTGSGTFFFDFIDFTTDRILDRAKDYQLPFITNSTGDLHWMEMMKYQALPKTIAATAPTATELTELATVKSKYDVLIKGSAPTSTALNTATMLYNAANISYSNGIVKGKPLFGKDNPDTENLDVVESFILTFARDYAYNSTPTSKDYFLNSIRYLLDQGYADGSLMETLHHVGYSFTNIPYAIHLMKDELATAGLWDQAQKMVEWYSAVDGIWSPDASNSNMDDGNTRTLPRLGACLYKTTDSEKVQYLKGFKQYIETFLTLYSKEGEGMKVDFTGFHHNTYFPGYSFQAISNLAQAVGYISQGTYAINSNARTILKKSLLLARVITEGGHIPNSLSGRNPFQNPGFKYGLKYLGLANPIDSNLLKAYNYSFPLPVDNQTSSYGSETPPTGFWQVNFANLGTYRQSNWVADIKGFNKYFWGSEIYSSENRYGRYQSYGAIEILYSGGHTSSGFNINGWDWNKTPGATTKHLSNADLVAAVGRQDETTSSNFAASLRFGTKNSFYIDSKIEGNYGIFGMDFVQSAILSSTHDTNFKFKKSVFCFDGKLICLGSNISSANGLIATNLFQNSLTNTTTSINVDNTTVATFPYNTTLNTTSNHWMIDANGTGYFIKSGNSIIIDRKNQSSPKETGSGTTTGDFASAYISHGTAPNNVGYEYVIVPQTTPTDMTTFSTTMTNPTPPYQVIQKDATAHIVKYNTMYGYSLFAAGNYGTSTLIKSNSAPCLVMTKQTGDNLDLSFINPDLNFAANNGASQTTPITLNLYGGWSVSSFSGGTATATITNGITSLTIGAKDGLPVDVQLLKTNPYAPIFYYEDFRYEAGLNGFTPKVIESRGQVSTTVMTRVSDVPDATDSNPTFSTTDRPVNRIPQYLPNAQRAIKTVGTFTNTNLAIDAYAVFTTLDMTTNNPLISSSDTNKYATFWTERIGGDGDIATVTMLVSTNYTGDPTTTTWTTLPIISGKLAMTSDNSKYVKGVVDLTPYANGANGATVTLALRYQGSSSTYSTTNSNGSFLFSDLQFIAQPTTYITTTWNGSTWSNGIPNSSTDAIIAGNYSENTAIAANNLTIKNNAIVIIPSGNNVTLAGALTVSSGSFTLENNAKLIQTSDVANTGAITVKRNSASMVRLDYTLWSSPVAAQNLFSFSPTTLTARFYNYATSSNNYSNTGFTSASTFTNGKGYAVRAPNDYTSTPTIYTGQFTGVPNNGPISIPLVATSPGFNLVGNPYPSPINANDFVTANASLIDGTLYFFSHNAKSNGTTYETSSGGSGIQYATWNSTGATAAALGVSGIGQNTNTPNGTIQVGQGFIVKATTTGNLSFTNSMRTVTGTAANADQFFKVVNTKSATTSIATEKHRLWLDLTNAKGDGLSQLLVGYVDGATNEVDNLYDGEEFGTPPTSLTSLLNDKNYTIQGRALPFTDTDTVPLAFKAAANGTYTIALNKTDGVFAADQEVLLKDNATGTVTNLKTGGYTFTATAGTANSRFELAYATSASNAIGVEAAINAVKKQGVFQVSTNGAILKDIAVYDMQGRLLIQQQNINSTTSSLTGLPPTRGVLILKATTDANQTQTIKIIN